MDLEQRTLDKLPAEILLIICSHLTYRDRVQFKQVSRSCYQVSSDPHLWREITWSNYSSSEKHHITNILNKYTTYITKLVVLGHFQLSNFSTAIGKCSSLKVLVVLGLRTNVSELDDIVGQLPQLEHLEFEPQNSQCKMAGCAHLMCFPNEWRDFLSSVASIRTVVLVVPYIEAMLEFLMLEWGSHNYYPVQLNLRILVQRSLKMSSYSRSKESPYSTTLRLWNYYQPQMPSSDHQARFQIYPYRTSPSFGLKIPPIIELHLKPYNPIAFTAASIDYLRGAIHFVETSFETESYGISARFFTEEENLPESMVCHNLRSISTHNLTYLNFSGAADLLLSAHLEIVADVSPNLTHLNLNGCVLCFALLFGISALAAKCTRMMALNVQQIPSSAIESVSDFWQYLGMFSKLIHLSMNMHLLHAASEIADSAERSLKVETNILELELLGSDVDVRYNFHPLPTPELMTIWRKLRHLRVEATVLISDAVIHSILNGALVHCKALRCLYFASPFTFQLHSDSLVNTQLKQLFILCQRLNISDSLVSSIVLSKPTHLFLVVRSISKESVFAIVEKAHTLVSCSIYTRDRPVFTPPSAVLEFRKNLREIVKQRTPSLDDFIFEEDVLSDSPFWNKTSVKSALNSDLLTIWI